MPLITWSVAPASFVPTGTFVVDVSFLPGVLIPNTWLGDSRLAEEEVLPLTSSALNPCLTNISANGWIGFAVES